MKTLLTTAIALITLAACGSDATTGYQNGEDASTSNPDEQPSDAATSRQLDSRAGEVVDSTPARDAESVNADSDPGDGLQNDASPALDAAGADPGAADLTPVDEFDPYSSGSLTVNSTELDSGAAGPPVPVTLFVPASTDDETLPVLVFQHGFLMATAWYSDLLTVVASHGFVVVAPQMYEAGGLPFGKPSTAEEVESARALRTWIADNLQDHVSVHIDWNRIGYIGHSRGGKVAWSLLKADPSLAHAIAGIDPVDGTGGPLGGEARLIDGEFPFSMPTLVIGTGLGSSTGSGLAMMPCAPEGDNHAQFYAAAQSPAYHVTVTEHGHLDMLDDDTSGCGMSCAACVQGPSRATMRETTAGLLVAFFEASLNERSAAEDVLRSGSGAPASLTIETK